MADILTLSEYKTAKGISGTAQDGQYSSLLPMVNEFIEKYCNRVFGPDEYTEQNEGITDHRGFYLFHVKQKPLLSVQSVSLKFYGVQTPMALDTTKLDVFNKDGYARFAYALNPSTSVIRTEYLDDYYYTIVYSGGANVPQPVKLAAVTILSDMFQYITDDVTVSGTTVSGTSGPPGQLKSINIGDYAESYETPGTIFKQMHKGETGVVLTKTVKDLLEPYRTQGQSVI